MEENLMATSLLFAILEVPAGVSVDPPVPGTLGSEEVRVFKYLGMSSNNKQTVRKALYDALYVILEYSHITRTLSMAIGKVLCNGLSPSTPAFPTSDPHIDNLRENLKLIATEAIDAIP
jgi:hypothetical protein